MGFTNEQHCGPAVCHEVKTLQRDSDPSQHLLGYYGYPLHNLSTVLVDPRFILYLHATTLGFIQAPHSASGFPQHYQCQCPASSANKHSYEDVRLGWG